MAGVTPVGTWNNTTYSVSTGSTAAFDYKTQIDQNFIVTQRFGSAFAPHAQSTGDMTIRVDAGFLFNGSAFTEVAVQDTTSLSTAAAGPRYDRIVADVVTGAISVVSGTEAVTPSKPDIPSGKVPICSIYLAVGTARIGNSMISDERAVWGGSLPGDYQEFMTTGASTWTKPSGFSSDALVRYLLWGGGGAGGNQTAGAGGGGGACVEGLTKLGALAATVAVSIGPGGASTTPTGASGTQSVFGSIIAYPGTGGEDTGLTGAGGYGGGVLSSASTATGFGGNPHPGNGSGIPDSGYGGGACGFSNTANTGNTAYGGAGGGCTPRGWGGNSIYGGAGGAGASTGVGAGVAGVSLFGGNGGSSGVPGAQPGGGGGGGSSAGVGGAGGLKVWVWRG